MLRLIPGEPNAVGLIRVGPWWNILHLLVQATTVLMLEISFRAIHMPEEAETILESCKKGIRWLYALGEDNASGKRAWSMCNALLKEAVKKIGRDVDDLPQNPPGKPAPPQQDSVMPDSTGVAGPLAPNSYTTASVLTSMYGTMPGLTSSQAFAAFDSTMQYEQHFLPDLMMNEPPR